MPNERRHDAVKKITLLTKGHHVLVIEPSIAKVKSSGKEGGLFGRAV